MTDNEKCTNCEEELNQENIIKHIIINDSKTRNFCSVRCFRRYYGYGNQ